MKNYIGMIHQMLNHKSETKRYYQKLQYFINYTKHIIKYNHQLQMQKFFVLRSNNFNIYKKFHIKSTSFFQGILFRRIRRNFLCVFRSLNSNSKDLNPINIKVVKFFGAKKYRPFRDKTWKVFKKNKTLKKKNLENYKDLQKPSKLKKHNPAIQKRILWQVYFSLKSINWPSFHVSFKGFDFNEASVILNSLQDMSDEDITVGKMSKYSQELNFLNIKQVRMLQNITFNGCKARKKRRL